jgi:uncharacterized protein YceH (UPF0502 family)
VELTQEQVRILGCLIEKERTTPDDHPLTANAVVRAANQTTSRHPVVSYDLGLVERELAHLKDEGLVRFVHSPSNRATKYRQILDEVLGLDPQETALLGLLFLRGDQTPSELLARSERLARFADVEELRAALTRLAEREEPLAVERERLPGQSQRRWAHRWAPEPGDVPTAAARGGGTRVDASLVERVEQLESLVRSLAASLAQVRQELGIAELLLAEDPHVSGAPTASDPAVAPSE